MRVTASTKKQNWKNGELFFNRPTMKFFGDTMANFAVRSVEVGGRSLYELYRKRPVKHGLNSSYFFDKETFDRVRV